MVSTIPSILRRAKCLFLLNFACLFLHAGERPNVLFLAVDDLNDWVGCLGGHPQAKTPNIDALAAKGLRFSQFYNFGKCCPTRAGLMTGLYSHLAGVGGMTRDERLPGYRGRLNLRCVTIGEALRPAGYRTIQTGKWHLGGAVVSGT